MSTPSSLATQAFLQDLYPEDFLPPLWRLIYHEGIRGHHILFDPRDVEVFERTATFLTTDEESEEIEDTIVHILSRPDLRAMSQTIQKHPLRIRIAVFGLYKRTLGLWSERLKSTLH